MGGCSRDLYRRVHTQDGGNDVEMKLRRESLKMERLPVLRGGGDDEEDRAVNCKHSPSLDFAIRNFGSVEPLYIQISETTSSHHQNPNERYTGMKSGHDVSPLAAILGPLVFLPAFQV